MLLWGSAAIFTRWGLDHGTPFALLVVRFSLALAAVLLIGLCRRRWRPAPGTAWQTAATGLLMIGCYSICYFQAMAHSVTPGVMATLLGVQPILTLLLLERRFLPLRLLGLLVALAGLAAVVFQSLVLARFSLAGMLFALAALLCMTLGAILQQRIRQSPVEVLPAQYGVSLLLCLVFVPFQPLRFEAVVGFVAGALAGAGDFGGGAAAAVPHDPDRQSGQRHQPVLSGAGGHRGDGLPVARQPAVASRPAGHGRDPAGPGAGLQGGPGAALNGRAGRRMRRRGPARFQLTTR